MALNTKQLEAFEEIVNGDSKLVVVLGSAGTGKSYTIAKAIKAFKGTVTVTASTNKAAEVLANMLGMNTGTTHRALGFQLVAEGYTQQLKETSQREVGDLLIIDELSMLPIEVYNAAIQRDTKVVLIGDPNQLPSIGNGIDVETIGGKVIELTEQMRQDKDNEELSEWLLKLRGAIADGSKDITLDSCKGLQFISDHKKFCDIYNKTKGSKKILAYTNNVVDKYNNYIHPEGGFRVGDTVIIDKPLRLDGVTVANNSDTVEILKIEKTEEVYFLEVMTKSGAVVAIRQYINKGVLEDELAYLKDIGNQFDYWDLKNESLNLKHSYASTIHKAQGDTYSTVFIDGKDLISAYMVDANSPYKKGISYNMLLRLLYVAISRMKSQAYVYIGDKRDYKKLKRKE